MTAEQFAYWLQGFTELTRGQTPDPAQWKAIREHLDTVFKKVTPQVEQKITVPEGTDLQEVMRKYQDTLRLHGWTQQGPITMC